jgi:N-acetylglutamate synthase-like GNAT family acetyltransferase
MKIENLKTEDSRAVADFILGIQNLEFSLNIQPHEQTDLLHPTEFYFGGGFWVAKIDNEIVGTIGLQKISTEVAVLRKMFVKKEFRGVEPKIGQRLFEILLEKAKLIGFKTIFLDTPSVASASHRFYERNGFTKVINKSTVPVDYKYLERNSIIYKLDIASTS